MLTSDNHTSVMCWHCGERHTQAIFCPGCNAIQPPSPSPNYFAYLGIESRFDIDKATLEKSYLALQQQLHPDRFVGKSEHERTLSLQHSMTANEAYNTLKDPFKRGEYLLSLKGIIVKEGLNSVKPSQALLMAMMELREQLEDATNSDEIRAIATTVEQEKNLVIQQLPDYFAKQDYQQAAQEVIHLRYLEKAQEEIKLKRRAA